MSDRIKHRLGEENSQLSSNVDNYMKIDMLSNERVLPTGEVNRIVDVGEEFNKERNGSPWYRLSGTVRPLISNPLFNITGKDSWSSFNENRFRDLTYPTNGIGDSEDITYKESIKSHLKEIDGWFGYFDPLDFKTGVCDYFDMEPKRHRFDFKNDRLNDNKKNWELTVTYPSTTGDTALTTGGLLIFDLSLVTVGGKDMTAVGIPVLHNVSLGETVRITGTNFDGDYTVTRVGMDNGDLMGYYFVIDVDPNVASIGQNSRFKKVVAGQESVYYWRLFEKIKTRVTPVIEDDDYEIYPLTFSNNIYNDGICQFVFNEDVDVSELRDNLGRPLSELFLTIVKTQGADTNANFNGFTPIQSGVEIPYMPDIQANNSTPFKQGIPDIRRIHDGGTLPTLSHTPLENNVNITQGSFYGDVVEYNRFKVQETILADVQHRFNTTNRLGVGNTIAQGPRQEGYYYKAHQPINIRNFSAYIEQGDLQTEGIPDYAEDLGDGRWLWRDFLDIGFNEGQADYVNYPFLNGAHYIHQNYCFTLKRQDPFGFFGLYYSAPANSDPAGDTASDIFITNQGQNVC